VSDSESKSPLFHFAELLASAKLAVWLIALIALYSIFGTALPQEGLVGSTALDQWKLSRPLLSMGLEAIGAFHAFRSPIFLILLALLFLNIAACTVLHLTHGTAYRKGPVERVGFILVHLSLLGLISGGMLSVALKYESAFPLIEGQELDTRQRPLIEAAYRMFTNAPPPALHVKLEMIDIGYARTNYMVSKRSYLQWFDQEGNSEEIVVAVNHPFQRGNLYLTQDETGYAPGIIIENNQTGQIFVDTFLALQKDNARTTERHRDVIPSGMGLPDLIFTLYPNHEVKDGVYSWAGESPVKPLLHIISHKSSMGSLYLEEGEAKNIGNLRFTFKGLRRWSAFQVMRDPGYPVITWSLWLGLGALLLRYLPGVVRWIKEPGQNYE
jgi:hypothetical protein